MAADLFGLERERKIEKSGVRKVFTPHQPIQDVNFLFGRQKEVQAMIEALRTPGQHAAIYGLRGVGKSSLANVSEKLVLSILTGGKSYVKRCSRSDNFESIFGLPLTKLGYKPVAVQEIQELKSKGNAGLKIPIVEAGVASERTHQSKIERTREVLSPSIVADYLSDKVGIFVIDEADALVHSDDKSKIAEVVKLLSDSGSEFKIMVVGIAETCTELFAAHPSIQRCLKEIKLNRMGDDEIRLIVEGGASKLKIKL